MENALSMRPCIYHWWAVQRVVLGRGGGGEPHWLPEMVDVSQHSSGAAGSRARQAAAAAAETADGSTSGPIERGSSTTRRLVLYVVGAHAHAAKSYDDERSKSRSSN
jgi:hypothetical protein